MKVKEVIREYSRSRAFRSLSYSSKKQYSYALDRLDDEMGQRDISSIRRPDFIRLMDKMGDTPAMANAVARISSVLFSYALDMDYVQGNPASKLKKNKIGTWVRWYPEEIKTAIEAGDRICSTAVALAWYTGQRESDVLAMKWADIEDGFIRVKPSKTKRHEQEDEALLIEIHPDLRLILDGLERSGPFIVFPGPPMSQSGFRGLFKRFVTKLGIDKSFHGIRKGVGSFLAEMGVSTKEIASLLNHKTLSMVNLYTEQAENKRLAASAVKAMPKLSELRRSVVSPAR